MNCWQRGLALAVVAAAVLAGVPGCRYANEARDVAWQETRPEALRAKYRFFKDLQATIDAKQADIKAKQAAITRLEVRAAHAKTDRISEKLADEQSLQEQELVGLISSYNACARDYNKRMADIGYQFCNQGAMPRGLEGASALRREFAEYKTE